MLGKEASVGKFQASSVCAGIVAGVRRPLKGLSGPAKDL